MAASTALTKFQPYVRLPGAPNRPAGPGGWPGRPEYSVIKRPIDAAFAARPEQRVRPSCANFRRGSKHGAAFLAEAGALLRGRRSILPHEFFMTSHSSAYAAATPRLWLAAPRGCWSRRGPQMYGRRASPERPSDHQRRTRTAQASHMPRSCSAGVLSRRAKLIMGVTLQGAHVCMGGPCLSSTFRRGRVSHLYQKRGAVVAR